MKYVLISLAAAFLIAGCASNHAGAPGQGSYQDGSNDRHGMNRVSNNMRPGTGWFAH